MSVELRVPQLGESVVEATITRWLKPEGAEVAAGEALVELETDKVNVEVPAEFSGILEQILRKEGETVAVNETLGLMLEAGASNGNGASTAQTAPLAAAPALSAVPTDALPSGAATLPAVESAPAAPAENGHKVAATPVAERLAKENGVDLAQVSGSGPRGKVTKEDVAAHMSGGAGRALAPESAPPVLTAPVAAAPPAQVQPAPPAPLPGVARPTPVPASIAPTSPVISNAANGASVNAANGNRREEREPMSRLRQTIAERLVEAQRTAAMLTTFNEVDMTAIMEVRKRRRDSFKERYGVGLGFMSFFTKAVVGALKAFPLLNAEIQGKDIVKKFYYDIGIAVGTEKGLVVPVVRDADTRTFAGIEREIASLAGRAREGKLTISEITGGTYTITNGGIYGSLMSTPILNAPQVGILGMHKIQERAMVVNGEVVVRPMMYLALSYDHRIVDGSEAVRFLVRVKELLEDPETLLLEG